MSYQSKRPTKHRTKVTVRPMAHQAQQSRSLTASLPSPTGGWNARDALGEMDAADAVTLTNWFPSTTTCMVRDGYTVNSNMSGQVESLFSYAGSTTQKLFGVASGSVYDTSTATNWLNLPGISGNYASTPSSASNKITGDIDFIAYIVTTGLMTSLFSLPLKAMS